MNIPHVGKSCARLLYKHGIRTAEDVAMTSTAQIAKILSLAQTTKSHSKVGTTTHTRQRVANHC